jgi:competence protein ComEA
MLNSIGNQGKAALFIGALCLIVIGYVMLRPQKQEPIVFHDEKPATTSTQQAPTPTQATEVVVHIAGRVKKPGLYHLPLNARVDDALKAAGGALADADLDAVNLASIIVDGKQLYIPSKKPEISKPIKVDQAYVPERLAPATAQSNTRNDQSSSAKLHTPGEGVVHLNSASLEGLQRLPGVGPAYAQRILDYRKEHGGFKRIEELMEVSGIGPKKFEKMRAFLAL